ncbi:MAG TPA: hypothetical protein VGS21_05925, partial [Acidimicrobiales bacterium]|nr:hypothetical protein [Acidimicrobiales bacterium]
MDAGRVSRRLQGRIEPLAANVYFAPEAIAGYSDLGLSYLEGYFCSRSACMGRLTGPAVTATFAVFEPGVVERSVTSGWEKAEVADVLAAREKGATAA